MKLSNIFLYTLITITFTALFAMDAPLGKRKAGEISTMTPQEQIDQAKEATIELVNFLERAEEPASDEELQGTLKEIRELLERGANPNATNDADEPALWLAFVIRPEIVQLLLEYGANPNVMQDGGPIITLTTDPTMVKILLAAGANPNIQDSEGNTPLFTAIEYLIVENGLAATRDEYVNKMLEIIRAYLQAGADASLVNEDNESALSIVDTQIQQTTDLRLRENLLQIKNWIENPVTLPRTGFKKII